MSHFENAYFSSLLAFVITPARGMAIATHMSMRKIIVLLSAVLLAGCGKMHMRSTSSGSTGSDTQPSPVVQNSPAMAAEQLNGIGSAFGGIVFGLIQNIQGLKNFDFTKQVATFNQPYSCPLGGTLTMGGQAQISTSVGVGTASGQLVSASGSIVFALCKLALANGETLTLDGTMSLNSISGGLYATYGLSGGTFTATSNSNWSGNLQVAVGAFNQSCAITFVHSASGTGSFDSSLLASGSFNLNVNGQVCGQSVIRQMGASL